MLTTAVLGLLVFLLTRWYLRRPSGLPPGPARFPFVGSPHVYFGDLRRNLTDLRKLYGDVSTVYFGETVVVVLNGLDTIRDALQMPELTDRPDTFYRSEVCKKLGVGQGNNWQLMRTLSIRALKKFGMGGHLAEKTILNETDKLVQELYESDGRTINPEQRIINLSFNIIGSVILSGNLSSSDEKFKNYIKDMKTIFKYAEGLSLLTPFPWLKWLPGDPFGFYRAQSRFSDMVTYHETIWKQHRQTRKDQCPRDVVDFFIEQQEEAKNAGRRQYEEPDLFATAHDLVMASTETSSSTLRWGILFLMRHPEVQRELQEEVDHCIGRDGVPKYSMRSGMSKMEAFLLECHRLGDVVPFSLTHAPNEDTTINGYNIPKGTAVLPNLHGVLYDPEIWGDPEEFRPWRFLAEDGTINSDLAYNVIAFGGGRRTCLGESLARMELFLVFCRLLQKFSFFAPTGNDPFAISGHLGLTRSPKTYEVLLTRRTGKPSVEPCSS